MLMYLEVLLKKKNIMESWVNTRLSKALVLESQVFV
jgi:hypothetical protein